MYSWGGREKCFKDLYSQQDLYYICTPSYCHQFHCETTWYFGVLNVKGIKNNGCTGYYMVYQWMKTLIFTLTLDRNKLNTPVFRLAFATVKWKLIVRMHKKKPQVKLHRCSSTC